MNRTKELVKQATTIVIDGIVYDMEWCDEDVFQCVDEHGISIQFDYDEVDLDRDVLIKTIYLN